MKLNQKALTDLLTSVGETAPAITGPGTAQPADIVTRINDTITNFKTLLAMAQKAQVKVTEHPAAPGNGLDLGSLAEILIKQGYGNTPIGKLLENVAPITLNQLKGVLKNEPRPDE